MARNNYRPLKNPELVNKGETKSQQQILNEGNKWKSPKDVMAEISAKANQERINKAANQSKEETSKSISIPERGKQAIQKEPDKDR